MSAADHMNRLAFVLVMAAGVWIHAGCTGLRPPSLADRFMHSPELKPEHSRTERAPSPTLEEAMGKLRRMMAEARPEPPAGGRALTLEAQDPALRAALAIAIALPTPAHYVDVALAYQNHRLLDKAHSYYTKALEADPAFAGAHEGLARVWRDWGFPQFALRDVHRAIYYEPSSASARNTLGTILQALGQRREARKAYRHSIALSPEAAFAYNNLCYLSLVEGRHTQALGECQTAIRLDPGLQAARNNLGLVYGALGRDDLAREAFQAGGSAAASAYNIGIVYLSQSRYAEAAAEFDRALALDPPLTKAARRARLARRLAAAEASQKEGTSTWP